MRIALLHNRVGPEADADEADTLVQVQAVGEALAAAGHSCRAVPCDLDLDSLARRLAADPPEVVFNLVEELGGHERLIHLVPALLDALGVAYTGSPTEALFLSTNKLAAKELLHAAGLPTPAVLAAWPARRGAGQAPARLSGGGRAIIKSVWDHGSKGLDDDGVVALADPDGLAERIAAAAPRLGGAGFAEEYIEGREFNLALLDGPEGPELLPAGEIDFIGFPAGKPRIVNYAAKWDPAAFEYDATPRRFRFAPADRPLLAELGRLALACWDLFGLAGWARVDFRVDPAGRPWILEINANPCLAPEGGFAAMLEEAGITFGQGIARIVEAAFAGRPCPAALAEMSA